MYYRQEQHMSYVRTQSALHDLHGVEISQGRIDQIIQKGAKSAIAQAALIHVEIQQSVVVHSDETTIRVNGQNRTGELSA